MADETQNTPSKQLLLQKIYIKDLSFESPRAPDVFSKDAAPQTQLNIRSSAKEIAADTHEVALTLTIEAKDQDKTLFLIELVQAGVFLIRGYTDDEQHMLTGSYCPGSLYPFAREAIADIVTRGGFPQLLLQPINFDALYAQAMRDRAQGGNGGEQIGQSAEGQPEDAH
jgi:preprotein translocase subunit SecB